MIASSSPTPARASIFIEGDCVGVRRRAPAAHVHYQSRTDSPKSPNARQNPYLQQDDASLETHRQKYSQVSHWLQQARKHEVAAHRAEKYSTTREKWARAASNRASTTPLSSPQQLTREPLRYSLRRAHDVLRDVEHHSTGKLLRGTSPVMGRTLNTFRPNNGLPGPGSYNLPSQF